MMKKLKVSIVSIGLFMVALTACKKNGIESSQNAKLIGRWQIIPVNAISPILEISNDKYFTYYTTGLAYGHAYNGTYSIVGDRLNMVPIYVQVNPETGQLDETQSVLYKNASFSVTGNILTLKYSNGEGDSPIKFQRIKR